MENKICNRFLKIRNLFVLNKPSRIVNYIESRKHKNNDFTVKLNFDENVYY